MHPNLIAFDGISASGKAEFTKIIKKHLQNAVFCYKYSDRPIRSCEILDDTTIVLDSETFKKKNFKFQTKSKGFQNTINDLESTEFHNAISDLEIIEKLKINNSVFANFNSRLIQKSESYFKNHANFIKVYIHSDKTVCKERILRDTKMSKEDKEYRIQRLMNSTPRNVADFDIVIPNNSTIDALETEILFFINKFKLL